MIELIESGKILETLKMPVREECDVVVAGGGITGVMAALAAAKHGAGTVLVEQNTFLGGSLLGECGAWEGLYNGAGQQQPVCLAGGILDQMIERLIKRQGSTGFYEETVENREETVRIHGDREEMPQLFLEMLKEAGVTLYLSSMAVDAVKEDDAVKGIIIAGKYGREAILAKTVIDATGSGSVARKAGVDFFENPQRRSARMAFGLGNIDLNRIKAYAEQRGILTSLGFADKGGELRDRITRLGLNIGELEELKPFLKDTYIDREIIITSNHEGRATQMSGTSMKPAAFGVEEITKAYVKLNKSCFILADLLKKFIPGFEHSFVDWTSPYISADCGLVADCRYRITQEDIDNKTAPEDSVGVAGVASKDRLTGGRLAIPYRALLPKKTDNLLIAGRVISSDETAWRYAGTAGACFLQGQAAGTAAAIAAGNNCCVSNIDTGELRKALMALGVILEVRRDA
jgi:hypothetical protein